MAGCCFPYSQYHPPSQPKSKYSYYRLKNLILTVSVHDCHLLNSGPRLAATDFEEMKEKHSRKTEFQILECVLNFVPSYRLEYTGFFEMIVGVLTTCHTQYT